MTNDIVLSSVIRSTVNSIQRTQETFDRTSARLATGKRVNSALDQPQNFFAAKALTNRASDFSRLLDGIGQSIRTIEEAEIGTRAIERLIQQAKSVAIEAQSEIAASSDTAAFIGTENLVRRGDLVANTAITNNTTFDIIAGDGNGNSRRATVTITAGETIYDLVAEIVTLQDSGVDLDVNAQVARNGGLLITSTANDFIRIESSAGNADYTTMVALGLDDYVDANGDGTVVQDNFLISAPLTRISDGMPVEASDQFLDGIRGANGLTFAAIKTTNPGQDTYGFGINGETVQRFPFHEIIGQAISVQHILDRVNNDPTLSQMIEADLIESTGQIIIRPISDDVRQITFEVTDWTAPNQVLPFGFGSGASDSTGADGTQIDSEIVTLGTAPEPLYRLEDDYTTLMEQIDTLVVDAHYRGVNLLASDNLTTQFNTDGSNNLVTEGVDFSSTGLGINERSFNSVTNIQTVIDHLDRALDEVRNFGSTLSSDLNIVTTRQNFTTTLINNHETGADDLTIADMNEEGANLLATQTRLALGQTALSLATQTQATILNLFGGNG